MRIWIICIAVLAVCAPGALPGQDQRAVRDDVGFCWDAGQMGRLVEYLESTDERVEVPEGFVAAISPHDDYLYAGRVYLPLFRALRASEVVLVGVTHRTVRNEIGDPTGVVILDSFTSWQGPRGPVGISPLRRRLTEEMDFGMILISDRAHALEHSLEALIPFLQHYNPDVKITPVMVTVMEWGRLKEVANALGDAVARYCRDSNIALGKDILFLISSDANHYGHDFRNAPFGEDSAAHRLAKEQDRRIVREFLAGDLDTLKIRNLTDALGNVVWCGRYSVPFGVLAASRAQMLLRGTALEGRLLRYSDTYTESVLPLKGTGMGTTAPSSLKHWVGFFSMVFYQSGGGQ